MSHDEKRGKKACERARKIQRIEVRISGSGGQGIISAGMLLGEAVAIGDGRNAVQSQSYGPEARGSATRADIIISDDEIFFPECHEIDILVALTPAAYTTHAPKVKPDGVIIADENSVETLVGEARTVRVPFVNLCREKLNTVVPVNICALGFLATYTHIVSVDSIRSAVEDKFAESRYREVNIKALELGLKLGKEYLAREEKG